MVVSSSLSSSSSSSDLEDEEEEEEDKLDPSRCWKGTTTDVTGRGAYEQDESEMDEYDDVLCIGVGVGFFSPPIHEPKMCFGILKEEDRQKIALEASLLPPP